MQATTYRRGRRRRTREERAEIERASLERILASQSWANFEQVISEFVGRGIPAEQITPKENVFTYNAWRALGRQVRRGEHGVKITTWADRSKTERDEATGEEKQTAYRFPVSATVFHVSQTDPRDESQARDA